jgi:hypothetical protein
MGVREALSENNKLGLSVGIGVIVVALAIIGVQLSGGGSGVEEPETAFYTDDDGKTFFKDAIYKVSPFDRNGKPAYRADVFKCPDGKQFVGLMYRHNALGKKAMQEHIAKGADDPQGTFLGGLEIQGLEVKRPGAPDNTWKLNDASLSTSIKCPSGGVAELVSP